MTLSVHIVIMDVANFDLAYYTSTVIRSSTCSMYFITLLSLIQLADGLLLWSVNDV